MIIEKVVEKWMNESPQFKSIVRLPGDASTRCYYRLKSKAETFILMKMEPFKKEGVKNPFLAVRNHLAAANVDVPQVFDVNPERGLIVLEDLGDSTLLHRLQGVTHSNVELALYKNAIDVLLRLQKNASDPKLSGPLEAFNLRFSHEKLMWEINFTMEHFYKKYLKRNISTKDEKVMMNGFDEICTFLAEQPVVFTHRDFHSRNIMVTPKGKKDRFVLIDFQDARMGPAQYDLASLLRDSYYQLDDKQIEVLLEYYLENCGDLLGKKMDRDKFIYVFDMMAVQRNFKAIGSFASFLNRRGNATYLKYIGNTFENIRRTLLKYPKYHKLREVLFHYYYF